MKKIIFLTILASSVLFSGCDKANSNYGNIVTFQKMYGGSGTQMGKSIQQTSDGGYIVAGISDSTDINSVTHNGSDDVYVIKLDSSGNIVWQKMYGGSYGDYAYSIRQTADGGYIVAGFSFSKDITGVANNGASDIYVIKLNSIGDVVWQNMYGGSGRDYANSIQQTSDGGYIVAGESYSTKISGITNNGYADYYVIKLDSSGHIEWQNMLGGSSYDSACSIQQTGDGGYVVAGNSLSINISGATNNGKRDVFLIKLDSSGSIVAQKMYGGSDNDYAYSIQLTSDGGCIVAGQSYSKDISGATNKGSHDCYVIKLDSSGSVAWQKMYGGSYGDFAYSIRQTSDNGYIIAGYSYSIDISGVTKPGSADMYLIKLGNSGNIEWQKVYGGSRTEYYWHNEITAGEPISIPVYDNDPGVDLAYDIWQTNDGGYVVAGSSNSADISGVTKHGKAGSGGHGVYILKLDWNGDL